MERGYRERGRRSRGWVGWALRVDSLPACSWGAYRQYVLTAEDLLVHLLMLFTYSWRNLPCGLDFFPGNEPTHSMSCRSQTSLQGRALSKTTGGAPFLARFSRSGLPASFPRDLPLFRHQLPERPINSRLVASSLPLEPCQNVGIQTQRHCLLDRPVVSQPLRQRSRRTLSSPPRKPAAG